MTTPRYFAPGMWYVIVPHVNPAHPTKTHKVHKVSGGKGVCKLYVSLRPGMGYEVVGEATMSELTPGPWN